MSGEGDLYVQALYQITRHAERSKPPTISPFTDQTPARASCNSHLDAARTEAEFETAHEAR